MNFIIFTATLLIKKYILFGFLCIFVLFFVCLDFLLSPRNRKQRLEYQLCCENKNFGNDGL